jgi:hypothetical protein
VTGVKLISSNAWKPLWPLSEAVFLFQGRETGTGLDQRIARATYHGWLNSRRPHWRVGRWIQQRWTFG